MLVDGPEIGLAPKSAPKSGPEIRMAPKSGRNDWKGADQDKSGNVGGCHRFPQDFPWRTDHRER